STLSDTDDTLTSPIDSTQDQALENYLQQPISNTPKTGKVANRFSLSSKFMASNAAQITAQVRTKFARDTSLSSQTEKMPEISLKSSSFCRSPTSSKLTAHNIRKSKSTMNIKQSPSPKLTLKPSITNHHSQTKQIPSKNM